MKLNQNEIAAVTYAVTQAYASTQSGIEGPAWEELASEDREFFLAQVAGILSEPPVPTSELLDVAKATKAKPAEAVGIVIVSAVINALR